MSDFPREDTHDAYPHYPDGSLEEKPSPKGWDQAIKSLKEKLIDTSKRNRLINSPIGKNRGKCLDIVDERSDEVFRLLLLEKKKMRFAPSEDGYDETDSSEHVYIPDPDPPSAKHLDLALQTRLTKDALHKRLLKLYRDSNSSVEEQGANPLFLALGFIRWFESSSSTIERFAPLVLLPVELLRDGVKDNFKLILRGEDLEPNHSFDAFLKSDFDLKLPDWPEGEQWLPSEYFEQVHHTISSRENWMVYADTIQLGFYSSGKFLMSKDLEKAGTTNLMENLLCGGFGDVSPLFNPEENLDERYVNPQDLGHIMEADASQTRVIAAAREGRNMVVQGPPGTGKSQTIANIIAVAVRDNQKVLFVAEKRAALDVVYDRLRSCGLGPLCLEMHSTKAQKKVVYDELAKTLDLGPPVVGDLSEYDHLKNVRDELNQLSKQLHAIDEKSGETPYQVMGQLTKLLADQDVPRPDFTVEDAATWNPEATETARKEVQKLASLIEEYGHEQSHPWRGANRKMNPMDRSRLTDHLNKLHSELEQLQNTLERVCFALTMEIQGGLADAEKALRLLRSMAVRPKHVEKLIQGEGVAEYAEKLKKLFENIQEQQIIRAELEKSVIPDAFQRDWSVEYREIEKRGASFFRILSGSYRSVMKQVKSAITDLPKQQPDQLKLLDQLIQHRSQVQDIDEHRSLGELVVGPLWRGVKTDISDALISISWIHDQITILESPDALKIQLSQWPKQEDPDQLARDLHDCIHAVENRWNEVVQLCDLDVQLAFDEESIHSVTLSTLQDRVSLWLRDPEGQDAWTRLYDTANAVSEWGLGEIRVRLAHGKLTPQHATQTFDYIRAEAVYHRLDKLNPNLSQMDGRERSALVEKFKDLDATLLHLSSQEIMSAHYHSIPDGTLGEMGILRGEARKKTRHMPLRKLLNQAGEAVQTIKPVFLMSPLSVAQYLDPDGLKFDLLLMDEASQVRPADAIGAVMRSNRTIIVGDQKQLPPTSFFERLVNSEEEDESDEVEDMIAGQVKDMESILALCEARGMPGCMLKWHYRSQHQSLIAVSNQEFYGNKLVCPPSPVSTSSKLGLTFEFVGGTYRRGSGKSDNPDEAKAVMNAVLEHARSRPNESLGIVAMSQSQQTTIQNEAELMRASHPELNAFCSETKDNPFFVKNLETVQGDERDVIFISIGYGRTEDGRLTQNFGPVSNEGGERRLNVLFTRAKKRCRVFASIKHTDIQHEKARHRGPYMLKTFLKFAETGEMDVPILTGREPDSPFEEAVATAIRGYGYDVDYQVGSDGFLIDLAVRDPNTEGSYVLAIECDGARYHSSFWARERDRMRQTLLEAKGWTFHRIWSTDWFNSPETETQKAIDAIRRACAQSTSAPAPVQRRTPVVREKKPEQPPEQLSTPYIEFNPLEKGYQSRADYFHIEEATLEEVAWLIADIVDIEGPVHLDIVVRKTREAWGYEQSGRRIKQRILEAAMYAIQEGLIVQCDLDCEFLQTHSTQVLVRDRSQLADPLLKKPEMIPPSEYRLAIQNAIQRCLTISQEDCAIEVARMFGFHKTSASFKKQVSQQIPSMIRDGVIKAQADGSLRF